MAKAKSDYYNDRSFPPAQDADEKEEQMISLAVDLAEEQLRNGTASSQVLTHYLKLAAMKEREILEERLLEQQVELTATKNESIKSAKQTEEMYKEVIQAMQIYSKPFRDDENIF